MNPEQIVRSWKNEDYRLSLSLDEQALLPENPAGLIELSDDELLGIGGGDDADAVSKVVLVSASVITTVATTPIVLSYFLCSPPGA
jgi:mersacidin/lichenicidin family type 2 lantibiotic